jgi:biopolymer transport protein ExbB/TolQ
MMFGDVENIIFRVSSALKVPVLVAALLALALVLGEAGALAVEIWRRRDRSERRVEAAGVGARDALAEGDRAMAARWLQGVAWSGAMWETLKALLEHAHDGLLAANRMAKSLADYDLRSMRRLERTRVLVRAGPALGLMGTLIPLSPALTGLAQGNVRELTDNLRVAFSVTVLGLLIGAIAFAISLVRDRLYSQDLSDMQAIAAELEPGVAQEPAELQLSQDGVGTQSEQVELE